MSKKIYAIIGISILVFTLSLYNYFYKEDTLETNNLNQNIKYVYPLGEVINIKAETSGILVIGYEDENIEQIDGIEIGDTILKIDDKTVEDVDDIPEILEKVKGDMVKVYLEKDGEYRDEVIKFKKDGKNSKLGVWVRNKVSGIGTLTFYDPVENKFNAIGHPITDNDTNELLKLKSGSIYRPNNFEIEKATDKNVGQINCDTENTDKIGEFNNNQNFGISGTIDLDITNRQLIQVGSRNDIKIGKAYVLFEDKDRNINTYSIKIENIDYENISNKQILLEITDKKLLNYTGGIVKGMSGAPIIQNNKIIGAITYVFREYPQKGYGIFVDEMIKLNSRY